MGYSPATVQRNILSHSHIKIRDSSHNDELLDFGEEGLRQRSSDGNTSDHNRCVKIIYNSLK